MMPQNASTPTVTAFTFRPGVRRPIVPLSFVTLLCGVVIDDALAMTEDGTLPVAWDIATVGASRREIRVLFEDVADLSAGRKCRVRSLDEAIESFIPRPRNVAGVGAVLASILKRQMGCGQALVARHIAQGEFALAVQARASNQTPILTHASVTEFFRRRCLSK